MIVAFDASILVYVLDPQANAPTDPQTGKPVDRCQDRVNHLITTLQQQNAKIIIPTPALAEVLVKASKGGPEFLKILNSSKHFRISSFDERAAVEFAARQANGLKSSDRQTGSSRAKAKFDDQIVAISTVESVTRIYSDDGDITKIAAGRFEVCKIKDIPLPAESPQGELGV